MLKDRIFPVFMKSHVERPFFFSLYKVTYWKTVFFQSFKITCWKTVFFQSFKKKQSFEKLLFERPFFFSPGPFFAQKTGFRTGPESPGLESCIQRLLCRLQDRISCSAHSSLTLAELLERHDLVIGSGQANLQALVPQLEGGHFSLQGNNLIYSNSIHGNKNATDTQHAWIAKWLQEMSMCIQVCAWGGWQALGAPRISRHPLSVDLRFSCLKLPPWLGPFPT